MALPVALQLYSVRDFCERDFEGTLEKVRAMGYDGVEFAGFYVYDRDPVALRRILDRLGLVGISAHMGATELLGEPQRWYPFLQTVGCRYTALPWSAEEYRPGAPKFGELMEQTRTIGAAMKPYDITLLYHNHDFEFVPVDGKPGLDVLYESVSADLLQTELDTCWVQVAGQNPAAYLRKYTGRAPVVHLKDYLLTGKRPDKLYKLIGVDDNADTEEQVGSFEFRPLGKGMLDVPAVVKAAEDAGSRWLVVEQDQTSMGLNSLECAQLSLQYLRSLQ